MPARAAARGGSIVVGACRTGCRPSRIQMVFSVYNFMDEKPPQCTIQRQNRTFGPFFVREIVHIEAFMPMDDAKGREGIA